MNKKNLLIPILSLCFVLTSCGGNGGVFSSSDEPTSEAPTSIFEGYVSLDEAIANTKYYEVRNDGSEARLTIETYLPDMYYNVISRGGYLEIDSDKGYIHGFDIVTHFEDDTLKYDMNVYGRNGLKENIEDLYEGTFISLIERYSLAFAKKDDHTYVTDNISFINYVSDFFQTKSYKYANEIEITLNQNNRIDTFRIIESGYTLLCAKFYDIDRDENELYIEWKKSGSKTTERIYDYKNLKQQGASLVSMYENEEVEFEATVISKDSLGNVYVANRDNNVGHIGIKVETPSNYNSLELYDIVNVKGTIKTLNYNPYIINGTIVDTGKDNVNLPVFDEEALVDNNGGGVYAANLFAAYPYFNDSVYTTYGYVSEIGEGLLDNADTVVELIFPTQTDGQATYHMELIIPSNLSDAKKVEIFNALKDAKTYGYQEAYELCLDSFVMKYDNSYEYRLRLMATEYSSAYRRLNAQEKIEKYYGLSSFPLIEGKQTASYRFGNNIGQLLEDEYGITGSATDGLFVAIIGLSEEELNAYYKALETYGLVKYDEMKDAYESRHILYQIGDVNVDVLPTLGGSGDEYTLYMWIYEGELLKGKSIHERLEEKIGDWFNVENFLKYTGTYDADYEIYALRSYAGKSYSAENPLYCVTIDTDEKITEDYNKTLIEMGYRQYRGDNNRPYTYTTRGQTHSVFYKDDVYLDVATYHTSDYTYTGHSDFTYRVEILIYKGEPITVETYTDLSVLSKLYEEVDPSLAYNPTLPSDAIVEVWRDMKDFNLAPVDYGYGNRDEAFVYTNDVVGAYDACKKALKEAGYTVSGLERTKSILFSKTIDGTSYVVLLMKEVDKGYLRVFNDIGGVDFLV